MDTTSGNRAIAGLLGYTFSFDEEKEYYLINKSGELLYATFHKESYGREVEKEFNYHSDWNQLMPVVEHIESLGFASVIEKVAWKTNVIHRVWFTSLEGKQQEVGAARDEDKRTAVWLAVVSFIEWYNENK